MWAPFVLGPQSNSPVLLHLGDLLLPFCWHESFHIPCLSAFSLSGWSFSEPTTVDPDLWTCCINLKLLGKLTSSSRMITAEQWASRCLTLVPHSWHTAMCQQEHWLTCQVPWTPTSGPGCMSSACNTTVGNPRIIVCKHGYSQ